VKGTTSGTVLEEGSYSCQSKTDYCVDSKTVREYYIDYLRFLVYQDHDCSNDENKKCVDGHCGCEYDSDCPAKDNIKGKCNPNTHTCEWPPCEKNSDCVDGTCCTADPSIPAADRASTGSCQYSKGSIYKSKYLCDPPEWNAETQTRTQNILELALNFLSHFFQR